ncbi:MAG: type IV secretion system DNA-binding domain-containing protein [Candidatus Pacebacteria bacterium]|nr:type IV secretion system DNA-binding domain-containing protein [Candidatus Paceibacterota bacterium]
MIEGVFKLIWGWILFISYGFYKLFGFLVTAGKTLAKEPDKTGALEPDESERENIPADPDNLSENTIDLGWYLSETFETDEEFKLAKISDKDRTSHFYVVGGTGTGKTKFLEWLIRQDVIKQNGFGIIDPHGDLIESIKGFFAAAYKTHGHEEGVPEMISEKIVLIDPTDPDSTVVFNPLEILPGISAAEQVNELISSFRKIWSDSWGSRMEDLLRNSLIALSEAELTLEELSPFLTDRNFREVVLEKVKNPTTKDYFKRFDALTDRGQISWIEPIMNKINAVFSDDRIRQMFSSPKSSFNLREIIDSKKILLIKLDKGRLKDSADLLGSLLLAKIQMAAFSRSDIPADCRTPFYLYIDEFQNFASDSFSTILSEARKYGLHLIMAHQTLAQIQDELKSLILGNTGIQVYFRLNRQDASALSKEIFNYSGYEVKAMNKNSPRYWSFAEEWEHKTEELQNLPQRVCYVKHKTEGGLIPIRTADVESLRDFLEMSEGEFQECIREAPIGRRYLVSRKELSAISEQRRENIWEKAAVFKGTLRAFPEERKEARKYKREVIPDYPRQVIEMQGKESEEKEQRQHKYIQNLIKRMAEEKGYKATIEQATPDGSGRIDVALERDGKKVACEISVTTTSDHELANIEKCLKSGYEKVIMCSSEKRTLDKIKQLVAEKFINAEKDKVLYFQPDEFMLYLENENAQPASKEERIKGYKVRVDYQPVSHTDKKIKREAVAQVILGAFRRLKEKE